MIYQISSGQESTEYELRAARFLEYLKKNYDISIFDYSKRDHNDAYHHLDLCVFLQLMI